MNNVPMPLNDPISRTRRKGLKPNERDENEGKLTETWIPYFQSQNTLAAVAIRQTTTPVVLSAQSASIGVTAIPTSALGEGLYRVSFYARITTVAGVSSSLTVSIHFTDGGVACTFPGTAMTTNTTATVGAGSWLIHIDGASPISYSTVYASNPASAMAYSLYLTVENLNQ